MIAKSDSEASRDQVRPEEEPDHRPGEGEGGSQGNDMHPDAHRINNKAKLDAGGSLSQPNNSVHGTDPPINPA